MDGELFTISEQDCASASESGWRNETGKRKGKQGEKRKMNQQNSSKKKIARSKNSRLPGKHKPIPRINIFNFCFLKQSVI